jgi:flavin-dependent dehydrogenase
LGVAFPIEGNRWQVTLGGWLGDHAPTDVHGFTEFARSLPTSDVYDLIAQAEPLTDPVVHKFPSSQWRHYEKLRHFPQGYIVFGDAICSFNPVYGQGMSTSAMQASALDRCLQGPEQGFSKRFFAAAASSLKTPWMLAVGEDFRYPDVEGKKPAASDLVNSYVARVHRAVAKDPVVYRAFLEVMQLMRPPATLFAPGIVTRVLAG